MKQATRRTNTKIPPTTSSVKCPKCDSTEFIASKPDHTGYCELYCKQCGMVQDRTQYGRWNTLREKGEIRGNANMNLYTYYD